MKCILDHTMQQTHGLASHELLACWPIPRQRERVPGLSIQSHAFSP